MANLSCIVVTPEATTLDKSADFISLTLFDGEIGIAPGHTPLLGRLGPGELRITAGETVESYYVESGFVEVVADQVTVLTGRAILASDLDAETAKQELAANREREAHSAEAIALREQAVARSRAMLRIAKRN